jgi:hypothetical protein
VELKHENMKTTCEVRHVLQETFKRELEFFGNEIVKMGLHYPRFANTETSIECLQEITDSLSKNIFWAKRLKSRIYQRVWKILEK